VAEDPVLGKAAVERLLEGIDIVDPFADERALPEPVLVHIGDGVGVGIDAGVAPV
jgi:hypothetical protein